MSEISAGSEKGAPTPFEEADTRLGGMHGYEAVTRVLTAEEVQALRETEVLVLRMKMVQFWPLEDADGAGRLARLSTGGGAPDP